MAGMLDYMIERSRDDAERVAARIGRGEAPEAQRALLIEDAANALLACSYVQVHGSLFARAAAERRSRRVERAVRNAGLEAAVIARLRKKATGFPRLLGAH